MLNRLLKEDRAIVTAVPGTTRDIIEEAIDLDGVIIHLVDTAGIRDTDDVLEREGIRRSQSAQKDADLQLVVIDGSAPLCEDDDRLIGQASTGKHVIVINKADLPVRVRQSEMSAETKCVALSAKTGEGIEELRAAIITQSQSMVATRHSRAAPCADPRISGRAFVSEMIGSSPSMTRPTLAAPPRSAWPSPRRSWRRRPRFRLPSASSRPAGA